MADYSTNRLYTNIWALAKRSEKGVNDMERRAGTYPGYLLQLKKRTSDRGERRGKNNPDMEIIWRFSRLLGVSINDLIEKDFVGDRR